MRDVPHAAREVLAPAALVAHVAGLARRLVGLAAVMVLQLEAKAEGRRPVAVLVLARPVAGRPAVLGRRAEGHLHVVTTVAHEPNRATDPSGAREPARRAAIALVAVRQQLGLVATVLVVRRVTAQERAIAPSGVVASTASSRVRVAPAVLEARAADPVTPALQVAVRTAAGPVAIRDVLDVIRVRMPVSSVRPGPMVVRVGRGPTVRRATIVVVGAMTDETTVGVGAEMTGAVAGATTGAAAVTTDVVVDRTDCRRVALLRRAPRRSVARPR